MSLAIYIISLFLFLKATKNICSFSVLYALLLALPTLYAEPEVKAVMVSGIFFMSLGQYLTHQIYFKTQTAYFLEKARSERPRIGTINIKALKIGIALATLIAVAGSLYYFKKVGISLFAEEVGLARLQNRHSVSGSFLFQRLFRVVLPTLALVYLGYLMTKSLRVKNILVLLMLINLTGLFLVFTGIRGNIVTFLFFPLLVFMGLYTKQVTLKNISYLFVLTMVFVLYTTYSMYKRLGIDANFFVLVELVFDRLTKAATDGIQQSILSDIPANGYYYGSLYIEDILSLLSKLGIVPQQHENYSAQMAHEMLGANYNGEAAAVFIFGEFYANFGFVGNCIASFISGIFLQIFYISTLKHKKTVIRMAISSFFSASLISIMGGPTLSMLVDYAITCFVLYVIFRIFISLPNLSYAYQSNKPLNKNCWNGRELS